MVLGAIWCPLDKAREIAVRLREIKQKHALYAHFEVKWTKVSPAKKELYLDLIDYFFLAGTVFATLPASNHVIISGYSQRLDSSTGKVNDDYLFSFRIDRESLTKIDFAALEKVDPVAAMGVFENSRKMTATGKFKSIEPFQP
jgi:hypothetical protein